MSMDQATCDQIGSNRVASSWQHWLSHGPICLLVLSVGLIGCVSDDVHDNSLVASYQKTLVSEDTPQRIDDEGVDPCEPLGLIRPVAPTTGAVPELKVLVDPNTGAKTAALTIEQAIFRALASSPEIRIVSFDPTIAQQETTQAAADFDPTIFGRVNHEDQDNPENSIFTPGQSETTLSEVGVKQKISTGAEWSASYAMTRVWDNLVGRTLPTRYEPVLAFQLKQPLLRDAGERVNLAGVDIAKLNYQIALLNFREKAEKISTEVIGAYWQLLQARRDLEIQSRLIAQTEETVNKVEGRRGIDATGVQLHQAKVYAKSREAMLLRLQKQVNDAQDLLMRFIATADVHLASDLEIRPITDAEAIQDLEDQPVTADQAMTLAMEHNPVIQHAKAAVEIADINVRVARHQEMPRLDLVTSASTRGLAREAAAASGQLGEDYTSYAVGVVFEYTWGGRKRYAEVVKRRLERRQATAVLHNVADQVTVQVKERLRKVQTNLAEVQVQREAVREGRVYLQTLEESEKVRQQLTPEFLLVKLQAQEILAQAERAENAAIAEFNIAVAELAQATGTVLTLHRIEQSLSSIIATEQETDGENRGQKEDENERQYPDYSQWRTVF